MVVIEGIKVKVNGGEFEDITEIIEHHEKEDIANVKLPLTTIEDILEKKNLKGKDARITFKISFH